MIGGLVEISATTQRHLSVYRGFLKVSEKENEIGRVPLDDITALILSGHQITVSKNLMVELAERKAIIVTCGKNWHPISFSMPYGTHFDAAGIFHDQIAASIPLKKRMWQQIVRRKIFNQALVLQRHTQDAAVIQKILGLTKRVQSGDATNVEAQAARLYWPTLMGKNFRRGRSLGGMNIFLNYGYTVLRAAVARAICGAGLHSALGLHHRGRGNMFALVDDLIEPFRPLVDSTVKSITLERNDLGPEQKRNIASVLQEDMLMEESPSPVVNCLNRCAQSLVSSLADKKTKLVIAQILAPGQQKLL